MLDHASGHVGLLPAARAWYALALSAMLLGALVAPASARQVSSDAYSWGGSGSYECGGGTTIDYETGQTGVLTVREGKGGLVFAHDRYRWWATDTRRADGTTLYTTGHAQTVETKATHLEGSLYTVTIVEAGQPFVIRDAAGNVLARDRGSVRTTYVFDLEAGEVVVEEASVRVNGPHPGFEVCDYLD